jgi:two-component sensor histidine kinase
VVTALGIVVAEVVTNSYDHAFPGGKKGSTIASVRRFDADGDIATTTISDDGTGFLGKAESKRHRLVGRFLGSNRMLAGTEVVKCPCEMRAWSLSTKVLL